MTIREYVTQTIKELVIAEDEESPDAWITVNFDIGINVIKNNNLEVDDKSTNRVKFTLKIKRK